jgi:hypothetical protein
MASKKLIVTPEICEAARASHKLKLLKFNTELEYFNPEDGLPRYNRITIELTRTGIYDFPLLTLFIRRHGSRIGHDNCFSFALLVEPIQIGKTYEIDIFDFDAFNEEFKTITVEIASFKDYKSRELDMNIAYPRAHEFMNIKTVKDAEQNAPRNYSGGTPS